MARIMTLDRRETPLGEVVLRRQEVPGAGTAWEILLGGALLVTSLADAGERALATRALAAAAADGIDALVGGLGLGATADQVLIDPRVRTLVVVERLGPVLDWHRDRLVPLAPRLVGDPRCALVCEDVFEHLAADGPSYDVVVLDVDHSPRALLAPDHARFYAPAGLAALRRRLRPGGVFGLWSGDAEDEAFLGRLRRSFREAWCEPVRFANPHVGADDLNTIYVARR